METWERVRGGLAALAATGEAAPPGGRRAAALVLLHDAGDGDLEIVYTRRRDDLRSHPGQVSFPGGKVDSGETVEQAAVREAVEEVSLRPDSVELLGRLPAFYIPPSRMFLHAVVAHWVDAHPLVAAEAEVAEILRARVSQLTDPTVWRCVELSRGGHTWAWQLDERHLLWGATAVVTAVVLGLLDPEWSAGATPMSLGTARTVRPWDFAPAPPARAARLPGVPELPLERAPLLRPGDAVGMPAPADVAALADAVATAARGLAQTRPGAAPAGRPLVLVGPGGTGLVAATVARRLADAGTMPSVVSSHPRHALPSATRSVLEGLGAVRSGAEALADAVGTDGAPDVAIDGILGAGVDGRLRGPVLDLVLALRHVLAPIVAIDVPTGIHPERGLSAEAVTADVTVAVGGVRPALLAAGIEPFAGDLYLAAGGSGSLRRLVRPDRRPGWRE